MAIATLPCPNTNRTSPSPSAKPKAIAPSCAPPPDLFAEIERRLEAGRVQVWKSWEPVAADELAPGILTVRADRDDLWERTDCPGVLVKRLHVDPAARRVTMLVRMAAGSSYPGHRHAAREECLVLEGSLRVGTCRLERGDYQVATRGSAHLEQATDEGCLLLISSSMDDELHAR